MPNRQLSEDCNKGDAFLKRILKRAPGAPYLRNKFFQLLTWLVLAVTLVLSGFAKPAQALENFYTVGVVPQFEIRRTQEIWRPILKEISRRTGYTMLLEASPSIPAFEKSCEEGRFDFAYMNPYNYLVANLAQGYLPLARDVGRDLYGIILVRQDSPIKDVRELAGKTIAFPAPNAFGASMMPQAEIANLYNFDYKAVYVRSHTSVYLNVALKKTDAGGGVMATFSEQIPQIKDELRILYETAHTAPHPLAVHPRVPEQVRNRIKATLLAMGATPEGAALLAKVPFVKIGEASLKDYSTLQTMGLERFYFQSQEK